MEKSRQGLPEQQMVTFGDLEKVADRLKDKELFPKKMEEARKILGRMEKANVPEEFGK